MFLVIGGLKRLNIEDRISKNYPLIGFNDHTKRPKNVAVVEKWSLFITHPSLKFDCLFRISDKKPIKITSATTATT